MTVLKFLALIVAIPTILFFAIWFVKDVRRSIQPVPEGEKPTKLNKLIEKYMKGNPLDPSATIDFLMAADVLEDPFAEAPAPTPKPPPKPADAARSAIPSKAQTCKKHAPYSVMDDFASHPLRCQICGRIEFFSSGVCNACGNRPMHPSWAIWNEGEVVDYYDKRRMEVDAYQMQKQGMKITIFDSNGQQLFVAPPVRTVDDIREAYGRKRKLPCRDAKGRFTKNVGGSRVVMIHSLDQPYPVKLFPPPPDSDFELFKR